MKVEESLVANSWTKKEKSANGFVAPPGRKPAWDKSIEKKTCLVYFGVIKRGTIWGVSNLMLKSYGNVEGFTSKNSN